MQKFRVYNDKGEIVEEFQAVNSINARSEATRFHDQIEPGKAWSMVGFDDAGEYGRLPIF